MVLEVLVSSKKNKNSGEGNRKKMRQLINLIKTLKNDFNDKSIRIDVKKEIKKAETIKKLVYESKIVENRRFEYRRNIIDRRKSNVTFSDKNKEIKKIRHDFSTSIMILTMACDYLLIVNETETEIIELVDTAKTKISKDFERLDSYIRFFDDDFKKGERCD